jgi:hypothetical protein
VPFRQELRDLGRPVARHPSPRQAVLEREADGPDHGGELPHGVEGEGVAAALGGDARGKLHVGERREAADDAREAPAEGGRGPRDGQDLAREHEDARADGAPDAHGQQVHEPQLLAAVVRVTLRLGLELRQALAPRHRAPRRPRRAAPAAAATAAASTAAAAAAAASTDLADADAATAVDADVSACPPRVVAPSTVEARAAQSSHDPTLVTTAGEEAVRLMRRHRRRGVVVIFILLPVVLFVDDGADHLVAASAATRDAPLGHRNNPKLSSPPSAQRATFRTFYFEMLACFA